MHEVVTLQFGQQANYVGTHYWNTQESYFTYAGEAESPVNHDISFRPGIGADGEDTYTPRTLIYDLKGAFGTLRRENALYALQHQDDQSQRTQWTSGTIPLQLPPLAQNPYQRALDTGSTPPALIADTVRFWSDYNHLFYHPRSIVQLNEYELNSSLMPFERWHSGEELFASLDREHDLLDRDLRPFLEECDQLQGIQILGSSDDAWGGFTARYLERIADDMGKGSRWVWALEDGRRASRERQMRQAANVAQSLHATARGATMYIPVSSVPATLPHYLSMDPNSPWHTSALQVSAIESLTLPARLRSSEQGRSTFDALEATLSNDGNRRIASLAYSVEDPVVLGDAMEVDRNVDRRVAYRHTNRLGNGYHQEDDGNENEDLDVDLLPSVLSNNERGRQTKRTHVFANIQSLRGHWLSSLKLDSADAESYDRFTGGPRSSLHQSKLLFPVLSSYPRIFQLDSQPDKLAIKAEMSTSTAVADRIRNLEAFSRRLIGIEDREALSDGLRTMAEEYEDGWSGSESDDDD